MKNYRKSMPPLDSLLFLHAAANNKSLTVAADELFVTQAAVSKRIHRLEEWLGTPLFSRDGRNLEITEAGQELATDVEAALDFLDRAIKRVKMPTQTVVRIGTNATVNMYWLYSRLKAFSVSELACNVSIISADYTAEILSNTNDLAILYCLGGIPEWECFSIVGSELAPAAAPDIAEQAARSGMFVEPEPTSDAPPLLEYENLTPDWINWQVWLKRTGLAPIDVWSVKPCSSYAQSIGKALNGEGIALTNLSLLEEEFNSGTLVRVGPKVLKPRESYYLCYKKNKGMSKNAKKLLKFLMEQ